jgi:hypothetical protein
VCNPAGLATNPKMRRKAAEKGFLGVGMKKGYAEYDRAKERMNPTPSTPNTDTAAKKPKQTKIKY